MVKAYLRYDKSGEPFGVISSPEANVCLVNTKTQAGLDRSIGEEVADTSFCIASGANESLAVWDPRAGTRSLCLSYVDSLPSESFVCGSFITKIMPKPGSGSCIAVGYFDGSIRLWDLESKTIQVVLNGHKRAITALDFSLDGHLLVSGSGDTDIVVWDLVSQIGLYRLSGHHNVVTSLQFLYPPLSWSSDSEGQQKQRASGSPVTCLTTAPAFLASGSKDGSIKIWDLNTQWCTQTIFDSSGEVWSLALNSSGTRLMIGSSDHQLKVYALTFNDKPPPDERQPQTDIKPSIGAVSAELLGTINRPTGRGRVTSIVASVVVEDVITACRSKDELLGDGNGLGYNITKRGTCMRGENASYHTSVEEARGLVLLLCPSSKAIEVYRAYTPIESLGKCKKRKRRVQEKLKKRQAKAEALEALHTALEAEYGALLPGGDSVTLEKKRETAALELQFVTAEIETLQTEAETQQRPSAADELQFLFAFHLKKKPISLDYDLISKKVLLSYSDGSVEVRALPMDLLMQMKGSPLKGEDGEKMKKEDIDLSASLKLLHRLHTMGHTAAPAGLMITSDDGVFGTLAGPAVRLFHASSRQLIRLLHLSEDATCGFFVAGNSHVVVGGAKGSIHLLDVDSCTVSDEAKGAHTGTVKAIAEHPKKTGFVSVSTDKTLRSYNFYVAKEAHQDAPESVKMKFISSHELLDEALDVKFSPNGKFIATSLLNFTVQIFYADSMSLFLTLYGHKLPVASLDISSDSTLLVTGSADKTIKIWGLDFGNIHKSWFAHEEGVTCVTFIKGTHYVVSAGNDCLVKLWDTDRREMITQLVGHTKPITCLTTTRVDADRILAAGRDGSVRVWERTEEQLFAEEERERMMEQQLESEAARADLSMGGAAVEVIATRATRKTVETIKTTERLMEIVEKCYDRWKEISNYNEALATWRTVAATAAVSQNTETSGVLAGAMAQKPTPPDLRSDIFGGKLGPHEELFEALSCLSTVAMHEVIIALPFSVSEKLLLFSGAFVQALTALSQGLNANGDSSLIIGIGGFLGLHTVETIARISLLIIHLHMKQFLLSPLHRKSLTTLQQHLRPLILKEKASLDFNMAAMKCLLKEAQENQIPLEL